MQIAARIIGILAVFLTFCSSTVLATDSAHPPSGYVALPTTQPGGGGPLAGPANADFEANVLLVQTALPWGSTANTRVLDALGYSYRTIDMAEVPNVDIGR